MERNQVVKEHQGQNQNHIKKKKKEEEEEEEGASFFSTIGLGTMNRVHGHNRIG
jgi:hypothetical protein